MSLVDDTLALGDVAAAEAAPPGDAEAAVEVARPGDVAGVGEVAAVIDVAELYARLAGRLEHIVRLDVHAPDVVIEDACQFAWSRLLHHRDRVHHETVTSWLARTAVHEALKLLRRDRRELSLEAAGEDAAVPAPALSPGPYDLIESLERLDGIRRLPERQQRVLWLQALGLSYSEIALHEGCTTRTVERQLLRARHRIRQAEQA